MFGYHKLIDENYGKNYERIKISIIYAFVMLIMSCHEFNYNVWREFGNRMIIRGVYVGSLKSTE